MVSLESLGLVVDLAHSGEICPTGIIKRILVVDLSGYHYINARFCACPHTSFLEPYRQLLRFNWFPASTAKPKTAFTRDLLDMYHKLSLQGKLNLYDFYTTVMQKTDNCGHTKGKVCRLMDDICGATHAVLQYRYHEISRCVRQWRHIKDLKRGGAGHPSASSKGLCDGDLAIECPACPHPGRNLPPGWEDAPDDKKRVYVYPSLSYPQLMVISCRWLYGLFIAMDANFRLKLKARGVADPELGSGLAYFVNAKKLVAHLKTPVTEDNVSI